MPANARDLMSAPVHSVAPDTSVEEVHAMLIRTHHGAIPIAAGDRFCGLVLAEDAERAARHGLGDRPVREIAVDHPPVVAPDASLHAVIEGLAPPGPGRVLVVSEGVLVGYIARSDLIEYLYRHHAHDSLPGEAPPPVSEALPLPGQAPRRVRRTFDAAGLLETRWEPESLELLRTIGEASGCPLFLVGGAVRDLLLGRPNYDLDFMALEDGIRVARTLCEHLGGRVTVHAPFGTATLALPGGRRIDVTTARAERYEQPGSLPDVRPAALLADLERRDFTINALAMRVDPQQWARIIDPYGGLADLEAGRLRALHNLSFLEDPARIVRAVRFERQLGFRLDPTAERFARYTLATGRLDGVGGERLKLELKKLLSLPGVAASVDRLAELGGLRLLEGGLAGRSAPTAALERLDAFLAGSWPARDTARHTDLTDGEQAHAGQLRFRVALALLLGELDSDRRAAAFEACRLAGGDGQAIRAALAAGPEIAAQLPGRLQAAPSARFEFLECAPVEALLLAVALSSDPACARAIAAHLEDRGRHLEGIDGHWLRAQGIPAGPVLGRILAETLAAVLDGQVRGPDEERTFALRRARELAAIAR